MAEAKQKTAAGKIEEAQAAVADAQRLHDQKKEEVEQLSIQSAARDFRLSGALAVIERALEPIGLKPLSAAVNDLQSSLREARSTIERGSVALTPLLHAADRGARLRSLLIILFGAPLAALAVGWTVSLVAADVMAQLSAFAAGVAGLLAGAAEWIRKQAKWMAERAKDVEKGQRIYEEELGKSLADVAGRCCLSRNPTV